MGARCFFAQEVKLKAHSDPQVPIPAQVSVWLGCNRAGGFVAGSVQERLRVFLKIQVHRELLNE